MAEISGENKRLSRILCLATLWGFAVAQPLYAVLASEGSFFLGKQLLPVEAFAMLFLLSFILPVALFLFVEVVSLIKPLWGQWVYRLFIWGLATAFCLPLLKEGVGMLPLGWQPWYFYIQTILALLLGLLFTILFIRTAAVPLFIRVTSPGIIIFSIFFYLSYEGFHPPPLQTYDVESDTPVVLVVLDELPTVSLLSAPYRIDREHFPNFHKLAEDATWYRNAATVHSRTSVAVPAILTGQYPEVHEEKGGLVCLNPLPTMEQYPDTLFSMLGESYKLNVFESYVYLCPARYCNTRKTIKSYLSIIKIMARNYLSYLLYKPSVFNPVFEGFRDEAVAFDAQAPDHKHDMAMYHQLLAAIENSGGNPRQLFFFHPLLPHTAWEYYPSGKRYQSVLNEELRQCDTDAQNILCRGKEASRTMYQRHLLQSGYVDRMLGEIIGALRENGLYDPSLIIVTADHGISFLPDNDKREITSANLGGILPVPLFIKYPYQETGRIEEKAVDVTSILPTILDVLGESPAGFPSPSLQDTSFQGNRLQTVCGLSEQASFPAEEIPGALESALKRKLAWFDAGLYGIGPYRSLVGLPVDIAVLPVASGIAVKPFPEIVKALQQVSQGDDLLPLKVEGRLYTAEQAPSDIGIVINGQIAGVTRTIPSQNQRDTQLFLGLIPEAVLQAENRLDFILIQGNPKQPELAVISRR